MSDKQVFIVHNERIQQNAIAAAKALPLPSAPGDRPRVIEIRDLKRNEDQNAKFHAMCGDVATQARYMGRKLTLLQWKHLFISAHAVATGVPADMVPGLEGEFVNIRESSADMGVRRMASLIEYVMAWGVTNGVRFNDQRQAVAA